MLTRMSRVSVLTKLGVAELFGRALVGTTARAEDAIWDVVRAMVTPHQLPPGCGQGPSKQPKGYPQRAGF